MDTDVTVASLMAVAAAVAANCQPCYEACAARALRFGAEPRQIAGAVEVGRKVRAGAAAKMDAFVAARDEAAPASLRSVPGKGCC